MQRSGLPAGRPDAQDMVPSGTQVTTCKSRAKTATNGYIEALQRLPMQARTADTRDNDGDDLR